MGGLPDALGPFLESHLVEPNNPHEISKWLNAANGLDASCILNDDVCAYAETKSWLAVNSRLEGEIAKRFL